MGWGKGQHGGRLQITGSIMQEGKKGVGMLLAENWEGKRIKVGMAEGWRTDTNGELVMTVV